MDDGVRIVTVDANNVDVERFFCYKSKPKTPGYQHKLAWLKQRFAEGMKIKILYEGKRSMGFIEYIPSEYAWRAVNAAGYLLIHCIWVVGKGKGKGYGTHLLELCEADAQKAGKHGVAMVTSSRVWLANPKLFLKNGYERVDEAPPSFELYVKKFVDAPSPTFPQDWQARQRSFGAGLTVVYTDQCPYIEDAKNLVLDTAVQQGLEARAIRLENAQQVQQTSPSPYGVFGILRDGKLLSYHYVLPKDLIPMLEKK